MKKAVAYLIPFLEKEREENKAINETTTVEEDINVSCVFPPQGLEVTLHFFGGTYSALMMMSRSHAECYREQGNQESLGIILS